MNAIFFGFKRCGKTTLGKAVAKRLDRPFIDTDELLGAPPSTLYHKMGEEKFRILEANVIRALPPLHHAIISVGGGAMINPNNVHILSRLGTLIYLKVDEIVLAERNCRKPLPAFLQWHLRLHDRPSLVQKHDRLLEDQRFHTFLDR